MKNTVKMTEEGFKKLKMEYDYLTKIKRPEAIARLKKAREMGDLSENSEYVAAKEDRSLVEGRIQEIEALIQRAEIVALSNSNKQVVNIGNKVTIMCDGEKNTYLIVGEMESDPLAHKVSHTSPIGKALMGKRKGDKVEVNVPSGLKVYEILDIS